DLFAPHDKFMEESGLYEKLNKFMYCGLDCAHALYTGDIGIMKRAGDWGTWMSDVVPYEYNLVAQFLDSIKSPV
ncbi:MAG: hypothetical protein Q7O66_06300, partial [Dehalococcoidia bacterium]|nr:hypothetical protein [Dehalococcoidia bacterium]